MPKPVPQAGVVAVRAGRVCLTTSRSGQRWVIPKGHIDPGQTPANAAAAEAWEEAGLTGDLDPAPLGDFEYEKLARSYRVTVYLLPDPAEASDYPEAGERTRAWLAPEEAAARVREPGLRDLIRLAAARAGLTAGARPLE